LPIPDQGQESNLSAWKRKALSVLPWTLAGSRAALLILEMPDEMGDDWPSHDPLVIARAALLEARQRLAGLRGPSALLPRR
jgi:hypothetical protein